LADKIVQFYRKEITIDTEAARQFAFENFNIKATAQKYLDEYLSLLQR
jgi:hypothetical protein